MSWFDTLTGRRAVLISGVLGLGLSVAGCFRPLYSDIAHGGDVRQELAAIDIAPIPELIGHYLREELRFNLTGGSSDTVPSPRYKLTIVVTDRTLAAAVDTTSGRADAAAVQVTADYTLTDLAGKKITEGKAVASGSVDRLAQRFAALRASRDAKIRVAKLLADQIETRLAAFLVARAG